MKLPIAAVLALVVFVAAACAPAPAPSPTAAPPAKAPLATPATGTTGQVPAAAATSAPAAPARSGGILRFGLRAADLSSLDPHFSSSTQDRTIVDLVFNGLIRYKPGDASQFEPDLATALPQPQMVDGKQLWTFTLRKGVMVHPIDGVPSYELTSDDVVFSFKKAADSKTSASASDYTGMTIEAPDAYTVKMTLASPLSQALFYPKIANYNGGFIIPRKPYEKLGADGFKTRPVGTGPFTFKSYTPQSRVELAAFEAYWRGKPQLDGVVMRYIADLNSLELGLRSGELDVINGGPDDAWVAKISAVPNVTVDVFGVGEAAIIYFNPSIKPLDKLEVRQAIAYALDRQEFLALVGTKVAEVVYSPVPVKFLPGGLTKEEVTAQGLLFDTDREKAKKLLADAGYPNGFSIEATVSEMTGYTVMYQSLQAQLAKVGIKLNLKTVDHTTFGSMIRKNVNPLVVYIAWRPNADAYLTRFFHSDSIVVTGSKPDTNFSHYTKIDDLIIKARVEPDQAKQISMWKDAQIQILKDMMAFPLQYQNQVYARSSKVDYGHQVKSVLALYPGIDETTRLSK